LPRVLVLSFVSSLEASQPNFDRASCILDGPILFDDPSTTQIDKMLFAYQYHDLTRDRFAQGAMAPCAVGERTIDDDL
jgi:hypothetical protein